MRFLGGLKLWRHYVVGLMGIRTPCSFCDQWHWQSVCSAQHPLHPSCNQSFRQPQLIELKRPSCDSIGLSSAVVSGMRTTTGDRAGSVIELPARTGQGRGATRFGWSSVFSVLSASAVRISPFPCRERGRPCSGRVRSRSAPFTSFNTNSRREVSTLAEVARLGASTSRNTSTTRLLWETRGSTPRVS